MKPVYKTDADPDWKPIPGDLNIVSCSLKDVYVFKRCIMTMIEVVFHLNLIFLPGLNNTGSHIVSLGAMNRIK